MHGAETESLLQIRWSVSTRQGTRPKATGLIMEDRCSVEKSNGRFFWAIYDGHAGASAAEFAKNHLHENFFKSKYKTIGEKLTDAFLTTDKKFLTHPQFEDDYAGTTAVVAVVDAKAGKLFIAHVGDSRAIVMRKGKVLFATKDHKPETPLERKRIEDAGGSVDLRDRCYRVDDYLAMSRALGDRSVKGSGVTARPDVEEMDIREGDVIVLASDGLWDAMKNEEVAGLVHEQLNAPDQESLATHDSDQNTGGKIVHEDGDERIKLISRVLRDEAYYRGSEDDISVLIAQFGSLVTTDELAVPTRYMQAKSSLRTTKLFKLISTNKNVILGGSGIVLPCLWYYFG